MRKTRSLKNTKLIYGFDVETYGQKNTFYCASIYSENFKKTFYDKYELIDFFKTKRFKNSIIAATNLQFDFMSVFFNTDDILKFNMCWRNSSLIFVKSYIHNKDFHRKNPKRNRCTITFLDTMNYAAMSVKNIGKFIGLAKFSAPSFLGKYPKTQKQKEELAVYNMRDAEISCKYIEFLYNAFEQLGATPKVTIASTSLSLFKNKYIKDVYFRHSLYDLLEQFNAYYGGRCEAFKRGFIDSSYNYYDFNSLYPSVMVNEYPNPNTMRKSHKNSCIYIDNFEGVSDVCIECPTMRYPLLPYRTDSKLLFPAGELNGWYSHIELRKAKEIGYIIKKVRKSIYFKDTFFPFKDFVIDLYEQRKKYQNENNPMEKIVKLLLNSLYGKFGQKFTNRDEWLPFDLSIEELEKLPYFERVGNFIRVKKDFTIPKPYCIPIWPIYTTAYARIKLFEHIIDSNPVYVDTDSLITQKYYESSNQLGKLKKEASIKYGIIVKPKFYAFVSDDYKEHVKIKGLGTPVNYDGFMQFLKNPSLTYDKFMKFKESLRRGFTPNEIQEMTKTMDLEDNKRIWKNTYNFTKLEDSEPIKIINNKPVFYESEIFI